MSNKLTCTTHHRRVMVLPNGRVIHRTDGKGCKTPTVTGWGKTFTPDDVVNINGLSSATDRTDDIPTYLPEEWDWWVENVTNNN